MNNIEMKLKEFVEDLRESAREYESNEEVSKNDADAYYYQGLSESYGSIASRLENLLEDNE